MNKKNSLILALDVLSRDKALELTEQLVDHFDAIKVGYPLILHAGLGIVEEISSISPVIADLKIADTPNTNRLICEAVLGAGADAIIAQAFPGKDSLVACADCARGFGADLFVVTEMSHPGAEQFMAPLAERMARLAVESGASGVVAPATRPERIRMIRSIIGDKLIISPGVGAQGGSAGEALQAGADYLIVGRSVYGSADPVAQAKELAAQVEQSRRSN
ncbi:MULTISPECIES: orotidine-5'-phosphate decarboxylase [Methanothrix]|jgi:orotidine-5'-phosphate decarboxylase|uniref:orotidine-5'-phosphate decarboxylase n=1 Tax=Methanothrix TaxID=2222 RepID=UPI000AA4349D|nr:MULTISPECIES: orotidine-5'-phosphate decarboxylase [Methanothrix]UEC41208.1 MAG: Orotidine 5'-phosphate decarboxylase [Methanothrix sp.]HOE45222.1 orotidine-5'-phosphate decarboxylase [Methanothrix soehngenii]HOS21210.1 orotidine-5'-phosphate decarboxylase [Methanothrix soehngenii]HPE49902.1 orotidine-5'-phosphate decarboxylase [Methanothrix soehngenii]HPL19647.1 orotidine-5'-phosphate decarboxylase [Methanothrix soehngenii]